MANRVKNKRALTVTLGFPATAGTNAYNTTNGNLVAGGVEFDLSPYMGGDVSENHPLPSVTEVLVQGEIPADGAPLEGDDQLMSFNIPLHRKKVTSAVETALMDIVHNTGWAYANLKSTIANSPRLGFDLKIVEANPHDATDTSYRIYRQGYALSLALEVADPNTSNFSGQCRRTRFTDDDLG